MESTRPHYLPIVLLGLAVLVAACGGGPPEEAGRPAEPAASAVGESAHGAATSLRDDFSDPTSGWRRRSADEQAADYQDGAYVLWVDNDASSYVGASGWFEAREFADTRFDVKATRVSGPAGAPVGLSCRQWSEGERRGLYFADIDGEGEARIGFYDEEGQKILAEVERPGLWGEGENTLRLDCVGPALAFFVNGEKVLAAEDDRFARGRIGLRAGGTSSGVTRVAFDDAVVSVVGR